MAGRKPSMEKMVVRKPRQMTSTCRHCGSALKASFCNLGTSPFANSLIEPQNTSAAEKHYPLELFLCSNCLLVQLDAFETPDAIFGNYSYFSSFSDTWVALALCLLSLLLFIMYVRSAEKIADGLRSATSVG